MYCIIECVSLEYTFMYYCMESDGQNGRSNANMQLHKCEAYEIIKLSKQKVKMEDNPAYGEVGLSSFGRH